MHTICSFLHNSACRSQSLFVIFYFVLRIKSKNVPENNQTALPTTTLSSSKLIQIIFKNSVPISKKTTRLHYKDRLVNDV
jgi:hypothetical protein